ncbi:MAG: CopG family transcriptional regulator [Acidimicrobiia bacterium]
MSAAAGASLSRLGTFRRGSPLIPPYKLPYIAMKKTSVYLTEREIARLERLSRDLGLSQAELIRRAIAGFMAEPATDRRFAIEGVGEGPGDSVADHREEDLLRGFGR